MGRHNKQRGQPGGFSPPPDPMREGKKRRRLPARAGLLLDDAVPANEHRLAQSGPEIRSDDSLWLIAGAPQGDCFIVINCRGECWDGERWVKGWRQAVQFRRPDPAYELCEQAAREAERLTGVAGVVCYIQPGTSVSLVLSPFPDFSQVELRDLALRPDVC